MVKVLKGHGKSVTCKPAKKSIYKGKKLSCATYFAKNTVTESGFSIRCCKRNPVRALSFSIIKGEFVWHVHGTEITIDLHADFRIYMGLVVIALGLSFLCYCLFEQYPGWIQGIGIIAFGLLAICNSWLEGKDWVDRLCKKLAS